MDKKSSNTGNSNKPQGWFSRRHQTSQAHDEAVANYTWDRGPEARRVIAEECANEREGMSPDAQLDRLDARLGVNVGAKRERARLHDMIEFASLEGSYINS